MSEDFENEWRYAGEKQRGGQYQYSDAAIKIMLTVKAVFHLPNRAAAGFGRSIFVMLKVNLPIPDHATLSRRSKGLKVKLPKKAGGKIDIVFDSTGLKVYGEGEWKMRTHGQSKRRTWRKLHMGVEPESGEIEAVALTENSVSDGDMVAPLLQQVEQPIDHLAADGSYDQRKVYDSINQYAPQAAVLIPPRRNAHIWQHGNCKAERIRRDENLCAIRKHGRQNWKKNSGYHMRSLAETTMYRYKVIFGARLSARLLETQATQVAICCAALNRMTHLGMPVSRKVTLTSVPA